MEGCFQASIFLIISIILVFINWFYKYPRFFLWCLYGCFWVSLNVIIWHIYSGQLVKEPEVALIEGRVCSIPVKANTSLQFDFCIDKINTREVSPFQKSRFKGYWGKYAVKTSTVLQAGQYWRFEAKLKPIHGRANPEGFNYEQWLIANSYAGSLAVKKQALLLNKRSVAAYYHYFRQNLFNQLQSVINETPAKAILIAILMGERSEITHSQWEIFQAAGTSHLLAISGLHIGIAAMWCYWLTLLTWRCSASLCLWLPAQKAAEVASLVGAIVLLLLSGFALPALRASLMLLIYLLSRWSGRYFTLTSILMISLITILLIQPFSLLSISFWLSFSAVAIIALGLSRSIMAENKLISWFKINTYLYLFLIPISWFFFDKVSWISIVANLLLIPLYSFIITPMIYLAALSLLLGQQVAKWMFMIASELTEISLLLQSYFARWNESIVMPVANSQHLYAAILGLSVLWILPKRLVSQVLRLPLVGILLLSSFNFQQASSSKVLEVWVFDIGQGLAVYLETSEGNLLFDTGWGSQEYAMATSSIIPFLKKRGVSAIDKVVISHNDADHRGGLGSIQKVFKTTQLLSGEITKKDNTINCHQSSPWRWSGVDFKFLPHLSKKNLSGNNASCVLSVAVNDKKLLITGDIEKAAELKLVSNGLSRHHIVVAPHHGSNTSSTEPFIMATLPEHTIFSTGYDNQWKLPRSNVIQRYLNQGARIWNTSDDGAIYIQFTYQKYKVSSFRQSKSQFWQ